MLWSKPHTQLWPSSARQPSPPTQKSAEPESIKSEKFRDGVPNWTLVISRNAVWVPALVCSFTVEHIHPMPLDLIWTFKNQRKQSLQINQAHRISRSNFLGKAVAVDLITVVVEVLWLPIGDTRPKGEWFPVIRVTALSNFWISKFLRWLGRRLDISAQSSRWGGGSSPFIRANRRTPRFTCCWWS